MFLQVNGFRRSFFALECAALGWPRRIKSPSERLDFANLGALTFKAPDTDRFPAIRLARTALEAGGGMPTALNAANEIAVAAFLDGQIGFLEITDIIEATIDNTPAASIGCVDDVIAIDADARRSAVGYIDRMDDRRLVAKGA